MNAAKIRKRTRCRPIREERNGDSRKIYQPIADCVDDKLSRLVNAQRVHNIGAMHGDSVGAQIQLIRNFLVRFTVHDVLKDFEFAGSEARVTLAFQRRGARELWSRALFRPPRRAGSPSQVPGPPHS